MSKLQALKDARGLIADPAHWITGAYARDAVGVEVYPTDETAVCFCMVGAFIRVGLPHPGVPSGSMNFSGMQAVSAYLAFGALAEFLPVEVVAFNDDHTHDEVLAIFDAAISKLEAGPLPA